MGEVAVTVMSAGMPGAMAAARPQLIRALNEQLLLGHIRDHGPCSRADLARLSGLSKPTVSLALATVEQAGLIREAGQRIGRPGRSALLYEIRPEAGFVLGLDVGAQYVRGALADAVLREPVLTRRLLGVLVLAAVFLLLGGASLALGYVRSEHYRPEAEFTIEILGERRAARLQPRPVFDPDGARMRS